MIYWLLGPTALDALQTAHGLAAECVEAQPCWNVFSCANQSLADCSCSSSSTKLHEETWVTSAVQLKGVRRCTVALIVTSLGRGVLLLMKTCKDSLSSTVTQLSLCLKLCTHIVL